VFLFFFSIFGNAGFNHTPALLEVKTDWALISTDTPDTYFREDPSAPSSVYKGVTIEGTSLKWARTPAGQLFGTIP
jgi:hypothetical protein